MSEQPILLTQEALDKLKEEYDDLVHVKREQNKAELAEARSQGDLSENADYDAAREAQASIESRIAELEYQLAEGHYEIIAKGNYETVAPGVVVTLEFQDTMEIEKYEIVGGVGSDPLNRKISNESPLAVAINGASVGEIRSVNVGKPYKVKILGISSGN